MEMMLWIFLCLFSSVGIVQCGMWFWDSFKTPVESVKGYRIIPLYNDPDCLEAKIRILYSKTQECSDIILLADMGLKDECRQICDKLLEEISGAYIFDIHDIPDVINRLDNLQNIANDVK